MPVVIETFPDPYLPQTCKPHGTTIQKVATHLTRMGTGCLGYFETGGWAGFLFTDPLKLPIELGPEAWEAIFSLGPTHIALGLKDPSILPTTSGLFLVWDGEIATKWRQAYFMSRTRGLPAPAADVVQSSEKSSKDVQTIGPSKPLRQLTSGTDETGVTLVGPNRDPDTIILDGAGGGDVFRWQRIDDLKDGEPVPEDRVLYPDEPRYGDRQDLLPPGSRRYGVRGLPQHGKRAASERMGFPVRDNRRTPYPLPASDVEPDGTGPGTPGRIKGGEDSRPTEGEDRGT